MQADTGDDPPPLCVEGRLRFPSPVRALRLGDAHGCVLLQNGEAYCWGGNPHGELGDPTLLATGRPTRVSVLPPSRALAVGQHGACALGKDRVVRCWGRWERRRLPPTVIRGLPEDVVQVATGAQHACALGANGDVYCFGKNRSGQLGRQEAKSPRAGRVANLPPVRSIAAGVRHTCALVRDGRVFCWGRNDRGQLGDGTRRDRARPQAVRGLKDITALAAGIGDHTCVIDDVGAVRCWGRNGNGQLGPAHRGDALRPVTTRAKGAEAVSHVALGEEDTCVLVGEGRLRCWGRHTTAGPFARKDAPPARELALGEDHACALIGEAEVVCWGGNEEGQLGCGRMTGTVRPRAIPGLPPARSVVAGDDHTCVLADDGRVHCYGDTRDGALGRGDLLPSSTPAPVRGLAQVEQLASGEDFVCARDVRGGVHCWGRNDRGQLGVASPAVIPRPMRVPLLPAAVELALGEKHACILSADTQVHCWGDNRKGQLGERVMGSRRAPAPVPGVAGATQLALGDHHSCARVRDGRVVCWGENRHGQLGQGDRAAHSGPVFVRELEGVVSLAAGEHHTCALLGSGGAACWGRNSEGQLGDGTRLPRSLPTPVKGLRDAFELAAGEEHTCALDARGRVSCWGSNARGQLGDGTRSFRLTPVRVRGTGKLTALGCGERHTCAIASDGRTLCWGGKAAVPDLLTPTTTDEAESTFEVSARRGFGIRAYGELRLRDQLDADSKRTLNRFRIRVRLSAELNYSGFFMGAGVRTISPGVSGLTSDNFTIDGNAFPVPGVNLAYVGYRLERAGHALLVAGGYIQNPFQVNPLLRDEAALGSRTLQSLRAFDMDYTPVGATVMGTLRTGESRLFATGAVFALGAQDAEASDVMLGGQVGVARPTFLLAAGYYHFGKPGAAMAEFAVKQGNSASAEAPKLLRHGAGLLSLTSRLALERLAGWRGASLQLEVTRNLLAPSGNHAAYVQLTAPVGRRLSLLFDGYFVQRDGAFAALADSDRSFVNVAGGSTAAAFAFSKNFVLTFNYFASAPLGDGRLLHRFFLSLTSRARL